MMHLIGLLLTLVLFGSISVWAIMVLVLIFGFSRAIYRVPRQGFMPARKNGLAYDLAWKEVDEICATHGVTPNGDWAWDVMPESRWFSRQRVPRR